MRKIARENRRCERCGNLYETKITSIRRFCSKRCVVLGKRRGLGYCNPRCDNTESPAMLDIAWAAGIYEGEGSCGASRSYGGQTEQIHVGQKTRWLCDRLRALFGGSVYTIKNGKNAGSSLWHLHGTRARGFLMTVFSFLSPRRRGQVRAVLLSPGNS